MLSNNRNSFPLYQWLLEQGETVYFYSGRLLKEQLLFLSPSLVISYNYKYIIANDLIELLDNRIINLHISLLPWNKGSNPNIWSFIDNTPKGVTIHQLSPGLDEGDILLQEEVIFDENIETFKTSYNILNNKIVMLLKTHWKDIKEWRITPRRQSGTGSYHTQINFRDLMQGSNLDWNETIYNFKKRIQAEHK